MYILKIYVGRGVMNKKLELKILIDTSIMTIKEMISEIKYENDIDRYRMMICMLEEMKQAINDEIFENDNNNIIILRMLNNKDPERLFILFKDIENLYLDIHEEAN